MVTVKISKRKRMKSKVYVKRAIPFLILGMAVIVGVLLLLGRILEGNPHLGSIRWVWLIGSFLTFQYLNKKYVVPG